jgi:hypothetical protein
MEIDQRLFVAPAAPLAWYEAVALVRSVADAVADGRTSGVPSLENLALDVDGAVRLSSGGKSTGGHESAIVEDLRTLLGRLLDAAAPAPLRALAEGSDPAATQNLAAFITALAFFERPSKDRDLKALAARLAEKQEERRVISEMERLTHKARAHEEAHEAAPVSPAVRKTARWKSRKALAIAAVGASIAVGVLLTVSGGTRAAATLTPLRAASRGVVETLRSAANSAFSTGGPASAPVKKAAPAGSVTAGAETRPHTNAPGRAPERVGSPRPSVEIFRSTEPEIVEVPISSGSGNGALAPLRTSSKMIFDRHSPDVIPAQLVTPQLTAVAPQVFNGGSGALEVLVAEDGHVERVRLISTTAERRYYDGMILPAVKSWVFRPATRGGRPVRYQLRIPLT